MRVLGRVLSAGTACLAVLGCAAVAVAMSGAAPGQDGAATPFVMPSWTPRADPIRPLSSGTAGSASPGSASSTPTLSPGAVMRTAAGVASSSPAAPRPAPVTSSAQPAASSPSPAARPTPAPAPARGGSLPLGYGTYGATQVITVTAPSTGYTTATLQAWTAAPGGGWLRYGAPVSAHLGTQGMTSSPSETRSATPMGSFSLTQAFGRAADPGTRMSYFQTTPADWWISKSGPLYNTHQRCSGSCPFTQGDPNEHLYYITPYYDYAVVIDYNTANAGPVRQGAGSAFFLHVTDGNATAGCVAIGRNSLVALMRWLNPAAHPRILIGVA